MKQKIGVLAKIEISDSSSLFVKEKQLTEYKILFKSSDYYLILKSEHKSFAITKNYSSIKEGEELVFKVIIENNEQIKLVNCNDKCFNCKNMKKLYNINNKLNFKLWKSLPLPDENDMIDNKFNENLYFYYLKEGDIIRLGDIKFILREFHKFDCDSNPNQCNDYASIKNIWRQFTIVLKSHPEKICDICEEKKKEVNNPVIQICLCEKYYHFKCLKKQMEELMIKEEKSDCISYFIKTNCIYCKKFRHLSFLIEEENGLKDYKFYELIDFPRKKEEEYLIFETMDFFDKRNEYIKYFFYVKFRKKEKNKNVETILIGGDRIKSNLYRYNKLLKIEYNNSISSQHALINYDIEKKTLELENISNSQNTLILQEECVLLNPDDKKDEKEKKDKNYENKIILELGNIRIYPSLVKENQFNNIEDEMEEDNPDVIEERP